MPEYISVQDYITEVKDDISSPPTSNFVSKMSLCKQTVGDLEEAMDKDREGLARMKKVVKNIHSTGQSYVAAEGDMSEALRRLGTYEPQSRPEDRALSEAFHKFAVVIREHSALLQQLITNQRNNLLHPLDSVLKGDLKGIKGDLKRPFDKVAKDYDAKFTKIEKEKKASAKEAGFIKNDVDASEVAEEMSKERKMFQLHMCDYLIKVNEIKTKKGVEFLQKLVEYYHAYCKYFEEGMKTWAHFGSYVTELSEKLRDVRHQQEEERRQLLATRRVIQNSLSAEAKTELQGNAVTLGRIGYSMHQGQGDKVHGSSKSGHLYKKSESRVQKRWQKRKCEVKESVLYINHSDETKPAVTVPLLTCQVKASMDDRKCFDLVSYNRTYHLMGEDEVETNMWMSVILNSKDGALQKAFSDETPGPTPADSGFRELQQRIIAYVRGLPGNNLCCDCGGNNDVTWLSTNYGILVCIECSGIHRDLGVHISRIQSLTLDKVGTAQLLMARHMTNNSFNEVTEATAPRKPEPTSTMDERREFIQSKYVTKSYVQPTAPTTEELLDQLRDAIDRHDLYGLLSVYFQGADLSMALTALGECALHVAIYQEDGISLPLVDFLVQNCNSLDRQTKEGNTPLHYCVIYNKTECMRLLLRVGANPNIENNNGKTSLDIARERNCRVMEDMLNQAIQQKKSMFENVEFEWNLSDDNLTDVSDDEENIRNGGSTPEKKHRMGRPNSMPTSGPDSPLMSHRKREDSGGDRHSDYRSVERHRHRRGPSESSKEWRNSSRHLPPPPPVASKPSMGVTSQTGSLKKRPAPTPPANMSNTSNFFHHYGSHSRTPSDPMLGPPYQQTNNNNNNNNNSIGGSNSLGSGSNSSGGVGLGAAAVAVGNVHLHHHKRSPSTDSSNSVFYPLPNSSSSSNTSTVTSSTGTPGGPRFSTLSSHNTSLPGETSQGSSSEGRLLETDTSPSSSPQESPNTFINGRSTESISSLVSDCDNPRPPPRTIGPSRQRRCQALYDCDADLDDEMSFQEGEVIIVLKAETEDGDWMEGMIEGQPHRRGKVPINFVHMLTE